MIIYRQVVKPGFKHLKIETILLHIVFSINKNKTILLLSLLVLYTLSAGRRPGLGHIKREATSGGEETAKKKGWVLLFLLLSAFLPKHKPLVKNQTAAKKISFLLSTINPQIFKLFFPFIFKAAVAP